MQFVKSLAIAALALPAATASLLSTNDRLLSLHNVLTPSIEYTSQQIIDEHDADLTTFMRAAHESNPNDFATFAHKDFPDHRVRIKETTGWCDPDVKSYTGYIDARDDREIFFYFFESRSKPKEDPVVMWVTGGPGCSSSLGLFMELGPCTVEDPTNLNGTKVNPHSWNEKANLFFLDQPVGVGFSHSTHGQKSVNTEEAAVDVAAFVQIFFSSFGYEGREFYMTGESYGGRYLPLFASAVVDGNAELVKKGIEPINLQGVLIGNGMTDVYSMQDAYYTYQCVTLPGLDAPINNIKNCVNMAKSVPYCNELVTKECLNRYDHSTCQAALNYCSSIVGASFMALELNPYDVSKSCNASELADGLCYGPITHAITSYLDLPEVRKFIGVDKSIKKKRFASCDATVGYDFVMAGDELDKTWLYVAGLLERGVRVMSYVGTLDWICNFIGNEAWTENLSWSGQRGFKAEALREWSVDGKVVGATKSHGGLTFSTVLGAVSFVFFDVLKPWLILIRFKRAIWCHSTNPLQLWRCLIAISRVVATRCRRRSEFC